MRILQSDETIHRIDEASTLVGILWPLDGAIAVNPLHDDLERSFAESVSDLEQQLGHQLWPTTEHLAEVKHRGLSGHFDGFEESAVGPRRQTLAERAMSLALRGHKSPHLAVGTLLRELTAKSRDVSTSPFERLVDQGGVRSSWSAMPRAVNNALGQVLRDADVEELLLVSRTWSEQERVEEYRRHFARLPGWAAWAKWNDQWSRTPHHAALTRAEFLAISLAVDLAWLMASGYEVIAPPMAAPRRDSSAGLHRLEALEAAVHGDLLDRLALKAEPTEPDPRFHVVTCIDVRSEPLRRALEANPEIHTVGFAGFFGVLAEVQRTDEHETYESAPVLVEPTMRIAGGHGVDARTRSLMTASATVAELTHEPQGMFALAEVAGFAALPWLLARSAQGRRLDAQPKDASWSLAGEDLVDVAEGALRGMGLTGPFGEEILLLGHRATSTNNPHHAGLECGACAGHSGEPNAAALAMLLNDPTIRQELSSRGIDLPPTTRVLSGVHDTTREQVLVHGGFSKDLADALQQAADTVAAWRASTGGGSARLQLDRKASDWSEVRPEWGLANHAAFVVGPRSSFRGLDLEGRVFLHSYDERGDEDLSILRTILSAPVVVAQWINASYYFSTVAPHVLGAGDKTLHNPLGDFAVMEGEGPDLCLGLPVQSLTVGDRPLHLPVRLLVAVEANSAALEEVVATTPIVRNLVEGEWIRLVSRATPDEPWISWKKEHVKGEA